MNIGNVHLIKWYGNPCEGVTQCNTGMGQASGIDDNGLHPFGTGSMNTVDQGAFMIALKAGKASPGTGDHITGSRDDILQGGFAIDFRLSRTEKVQVGAIEHENIFRHDCLVDIIYFEFSCILPLNRRNWQEKEHKNR
jgi:hypothetical protein